MFDTSLPMDIKYKEPHVISSACGVCEWNHKARRNKCTDLY